MASTALGKLQGQGLIETTTAGLQQTGAQLATTPMGATMQGRTPSSVKMAGTQPSKVNALAAGMQDVSSVALAGLRETSRIMEGTDAEKTLVDQAQRSIPLGRVDDVLAKKALSLLQKKLGEFKLVDATLDVKKLQGLNFNQDEIDAVQRSVNDLLGVSIVGQSGGAKAGFDTGDVAELNKIIKRITGSTKDVILWDGDEKTLPSTYTMATAISQLFTNESKESMQKKISDAMLEAKAETTIGSLAGTADNTNDGLLRDIFQTPDKQPTPSHDELVNLLAGITGKTADEINKMQIQDVTAAIKSWKESEFKDVAKLREILQSKDASFAQQQLARKELRRLGQIGITAAADKAEDLEKQIQEGDTISFGGKEWTYEQMFSDPTMIDDLSTWVSDPESAPAELRAWVKSNQDAITNKITELLGDATKGLTEATTRVTKNKQDVALPDGVVLDSNAYEAFFPGWDKGSLDPHSVFLGATAVAEEQEIGDAAVAKAEEELKEGETLADKYLDLTAEESAKLTDAQKKDLALQKIRQDALNADPEYVKAQKYKLLQNDKYGENTASLLTGLTGLGQEGKDIFKELTVAEIQQLSLTDAAVNRFLLGITNRRNAAAFSGTTNLKQEFKDTMSALNLGSTAALFANLEGVDLKEFADIFKEAGLSGYLAGNKFALSKLTDQIKAIGKMSVSDLMQGKNRTIIDNLSSLHAKLTAEFGRVGMREEKPLKESKRDAEFVKSGKAGAYAKTSKQKLDELVAEKDRIGGVNHQNMLNRDAARDAFNKEVPDLLKAMGQSPYATTIRAPARLQFQRGLIGDMQYDSAVAAYNKYLQLKGNYNAAEALFRRSSTDFDNANNNISNFQNKRAQYDAERQARYTSWWQKYEEGLGDRNEALRKRYDKLQSLFTTGVAA